MNNEMINEAMDTATEATAQAAAKKLNIEEIGIAALAGIGLGTLIWEGYKGTKKLVAKIKEKKVEAVDEAGEPVEVEVVAKDEVVEEKKKTSKKAAKTTE